MNIHRLLLSIYTRAELGLDPGCEPSSMYHVGQVVKCRITCSIPASRRINLSFMMKPTRFASLFILLICSVDGCVSSPADFKVKNILFLGRYAGSSSLMFPALLTWYSIMFQATAILSFSVTGKWLLKCICLLTIWSWNCCNYVSLKQNNEIMKEGSCPAAVYQLIWLICGCWEVLIFNVLYCSFSISCKILFLSYNAFVALFKFWITGFLMMIWSSWVVLFLELLMW